ncbi:epididymal secretory protein E1 isoform X2 [Zootermopsis nevadensis]|uniref:epididymal secretory protein E1 isoform X1 n=1 Tax=Zootermopsis nevadensis TaxID=136037 RepID=UPI000B8E8000|nr:epididymal secretory protein E1 isoform X1 [Zootermopsis nevadensis]XP_021915171.1 epididymal secretory protein E1 isoform X2 [Zootermopsis nevadensis]
MFRSTVMLFMFWCACANAVEFEDCGSVYDALAINIDGCTSAPCNILIGSSTTVTSRFVAGFESDALYQDVYLRLNGINIDVDATPAPCSAGSETVCPVKAGAVNQYSAVVKFSEDLPPLAGSLYWKLNNSDGSNVICYKIAVRIVYGSKLVDTLQQP